MAKIKNLISKERIKNAFGEQYALSKEIKTKLSEMINDIANETIIDLSLSKSGYIKYSSQLIIQWGEITVSNAGVTFDLPISFISAETYQIIGSGSGGGQYTSGFSFDPITGSQAKARYGTNTMVTLRFIAIGH